MQTGHTNTTKATTLRVTLALCATALFLLALYAPPAFATNEHLYDPTLSLTGSTVVTVEDEVPDPGTAHPAKRFESPCGTATDPHGDIYVGSLVFGKETTGRIDVFNPQGEFLLRKEATTIRCGLAVDSEGNVYVGGIEGEEVDLFHPSTYPPTASTTYSLAKAFDSFLPHKCPSRALAVDPSNDHFYLSGICVTLEYGSAAEGSPLIKETPIPNEEITGGDTTQSGSLSGIDVYGQNHDVYAAVKIQACDGIICKELPSRVYVFDGSDNHVKCEILGAESPGDLDFGLGASVAVDQSNGDLYVYSINQNTVYQFAAPEEGECEFIGKLPTPPILTGNAPLIDIAVDDPMAEGEAGYDSPNEGYVYVTSGIKASASHLWAYRPIFGEKFPLTVTNTGSGSGTVTSSSGGINCGSECSAKYEDGRTVTLTATPDTGSTFSGWSGSGCTGTASCEVTMSEAKSVSAEFTEEAGPVFHTLTITVTGNGSVSANEGQISGCTSAGGPACEGEYPDGTHVTLTETPGAHSAFNGWQTLQCDESTATTCEVVLSGDEAVAAGFIDTATLTVATEGSGSGTVTSSPGLISCSPFCADEIAKGAKVTLTATPAPGSTFYSWKGCDKGGVNGRQCTVAMDKAKTVTAVFSSTHALTLAKAAGSGSGKVQSSPGGILCLAGCQATSASFLATATVKLTPTPAKHVAFTEWLGDCSGSGPCELSMGEDHEVQAKFTEVPKEPLNLVKTGGGTGTVKSDPSGINCGATCSSSTAAYYQGDLVTLTATPAKGSAFGGWSGGGCSGTGSCEVTITEAEEVQAEFR